MATNEQVTETVFLDYKKLYKAMKSAYEFMRAENERNKEVARELTLELEKLREIHGTDDGADSKYN